MTLNESSSFALRRWPLAVALVFCFYALVLLSNAYQSNTQLRLSADARLVADSKRRAAAIGDFVSQRRRIADELAALHELKTYYANEALGMSRRYGLDASLGAVEMRFAAWIAGHGADDEHGLRRLAYVDAQGTTLADTGLSTLSTQPPLPSLPPTAGRDTTVTIDLARGFIVAIAPVRFKEEYKGSVIAISDIGQLFRSLIRPDRGGTYHEALLTTQGVEVASAPALADLHDPRELPSSSASLRLYTPTLARLLAALPPHQPTELAAMDAPTARSAGDGVAVQAPVPGLQALLVTTLSRDEIYGHLTSTGVLLSLGILPVLLLLAAHRVDRLQQRAHALQLGAVREEGQRQLLQDRNDGLALEIERRSAVEAELQQRRQHLEDLVRQRTDELNRLFHALPDLYFRIAGDGTILEYRAGREADLALPPEDFMGKRMQEVLPDEAVRPLAAALAQLAAGSEQAVVEYGLTVASGRQHYEARMLPLEGGQRVAVVRNVTERHENDALREANRQEAERLMRVKSEFLANMSHEIRTPLNAVLGLAQLGGRQRDPVAARADFQRIEEAGRHLLGIIDDILDLSKLEAGKLAIEQLPFRLADVVDAVALVAGRAAAKNLRLRVDLCPRLPAWVLGDALRIKQVMLNLLANAVKFTEQGEVSLHVRQAEEAGSPIEFEVADTGVGITSEVLKRLFQPFEQADGSTTRRFGGTGLGLAISHNLATLMGGEIAVHSVAEVGSRFTLRLPLPTAATPEPAPRLDPTDDAPGPRLRGLRVLAAEDVEVNRIVLESQLTHEGATVHFAVDGAEAVAAVARAGGDDYDAVLMDVQMPIMDGIEATGRIQRMAPTLPVIGFTAHAMAEERLRCLAAGMVDCVVKPVDMDLLVAALLRHARARPLSAARPPARPPRQATAGAETHPAA